MSTPTNQTTKPESSGFFTQVFDTLKHRAMHPLESIAGAVEQYQNMPLNELAANALPSGGIAGTFVRAEKSLVSRATNLLAEGVDAGTIKAVHNLSQDAAGVWKSEVSDKAANINYPKLFDVPGQRPYRAANLAEVYQHPELQQMYPDVFKNYDVLFERLPKGSTVSGTTKTPKTIIAGEKTYTIPGSIKIFLDEQQLRNPTELTTQHVKDVIVHEVQHTIQAEEGWQTGASVSTLRERILKELEGSDMSQSMQADVSLSKAQDEYMRTAGEVEARLAELRSHMTIDELKYYHPNVMGEIPISKQILK